MNLLRETKTTYDTETGEKKIEFLGFESPKENWSKLPHELIAALPLIETLAEMKVILYVLRHTWGYQDEEKRISTDEFCNGRKLKGGGRIDNGIGMSENSVRDGIERAVSHGFIEISKRDESDAARIKIYYSLKDSTSEVRPSNVAPLDSTSAPLPSEVAYRTKKETIERNHKKVLSAGISKLTATDEFNAIPSASDTAKESIKKTLSSPDLGRKTGVGDAKRGREYELAEISALVASVQDQTTIPVEAFLARGTSFAYPYTKAVEPLLQDIKKGVFSRSDVDDAVRHLMNGDGEKYKKLSFSPTTIVGHIAEMIAKMKAGEIAPESKVIKNDDGSYYL